MIGAFERFANLRRGCAVVAGALALALAPGCAKTAPEPPKSELDQVLASHLQARGGEAKLKALKSIRESGTVKASDGRLAKVVREIERPNRFRLEFSYQGTKSVFANDGTVGWQVAPLQGEYEPRKVEAAQDAAGGADQRDLEGSLVDWKAKGHKVEIVGREPLAGGEAFKLKETLAGGAVRYDWIDAKTHQMVKSEVTRIVGGHPAVLENVFSDFREVGGLVFPHRIETRTQGRPRTLTILVEKIELDPVLEPARFQYPG